MNKFLTILSLIAFFAATSAHAQCCNNAAKPCDKTKASACAQNAKDVTGVTAYYFHATRRCATCQAVEEVTKELLKDAYGNKIQFKSIDREQDKKNALLKKYKISGQTLLIIKGDKVVNLTNEAFLYARTDPDKFKEKLKSTIESM
jgi:hypothetical protein